MGCKPWWKLILKLPEDLMRLLLGEDSGVYECVGESVGQQISAETKVNYYSIVMRHYHYRHKNKRIGLNHLPTYLSILDSQIRCFLAINLFYNFL